MGGWIRHRGSKKQPDFLDGKKFQVRTRNGCIVDINLGGSDDWWNHEKEPYDIMAYRILEDDPALVDSDGWIEWHGGECPVAEGMLVDVEFRNGRVENATPAGEYNDGCGRMQAVDWFHNGFQYDIIAYRLSKPDWPEDRVDVIGQNGNDGLHYDVEQKPAPEVIEKLQQLASNAEDAFERGKANKYQRTIKGVTVDVYDVLVAFDVTCPAMAHAIKKMLMPGQRGSKNSEQDKREAIQAIERSIELSKGDK